jgi:four helix bundle protein
MVMITRFEDILAWQKARELNKLVYELTQLPKFKKDFSLVDQIRRSGISIMSNIAEGFARATDKEFSHFLYIAHGSVAELQSQLYAAFDQSYIDDKQFDTGYKLSEEVSKLIQGFSNYLRKQTPTETHRLQTY